MLAARYLGPNQIEPSQVPEPSPGEGEALIKVEACGFCGSDLGILSGLHPRAKAPLTLGHEFCGRVVDVRHPNGSRSSERPRNCISAHLVRPVPGLQDGEPSRVSCTCDSMASTRMAAWLS